MAFGAAAEGLAAVAGDGQDPMRAAFGPVGAACNACHDAYQAEQ
jgi:cytochrome c556